MTCPSAGEALATRTLYAPSTSPATTRTSPWRSTCPPMAAVIYRCTRKFPKRKPKASKSEKTGPAGKRPAKPGASKRKKEA